jgi:hypothetical protein
MYLVRAWKRDREAGPLTVFVPVLAGVAGLILGQEAVSPPGTRTQNTPFIYGAAYAVLLAFVVIVVWEEYGQAQVQPKAFQEVLQSFENDPEH